MGEIIGYARVSTREQNLSSQIDALNHKYDKLRQQSSKSRSCRAVIPDQGICHDNGLSRVGGICQHLKIACHRSVEYDLADAVPRGANTCPLKYCTVFQY